MPIQLQSPAFRQRDKIPSKYTAEGENISPPLEWDGIPDRARTLVLVVDDRDAPAGIFVHWVIFNLPAAQRSLPEGVPRKPRLAGGVKQGVNSYGEIGYEGPKPPPNDPHHYHFHIYALDSAIDLPPGATKEQLLATMFGHVLDEGDLMAPYAASPEQAVR